MSTDRIFVDDSDDFSELVDRLGWQTRVHQTVKGSLGLDLQIHNSEQLTLFKTSTKTANFRDIQTPANATTFGLFRPAGGTNSWCHRTFGDDGLLKMPAGSYSAANSAGFIGYQLAFDSHFVEQALIQLELPEIPSSEATIPRSRSMSSAMDLLLNSSEASLMRHLSDALLSDFLSSFCGVASISRDRAWQRRRAFDNAREYMNAHLGDAITLSDVCRAIGASRRSITGAFHESLGISPKAYLKIIRLNAVRRSLRAARFGELRVTDVANDAGFWHMGQLAQDYRKLFGELPSDTLAAQTSVTS